MDRITILDGAMGTELLRRGVTPGRFSEEVNLTAPEIVQAIQRDYIAAGSDILYACSFGANRHKAPDGDIPAVIAAAIRNARAAAAGTGVRVGLDVGPLGALLEPYGPLTEAEARAAYREVFEAGRGVDLCALETYFDLREAVLALEEAKRITGLPVLVTLTFGAAGRTLLGDDIPGMAAALEAAGADAIGLNCSLGPVEALPLLRQLRDCSRLPLICKPNAGMPDPRTGAYPLSASEFADAMLPILRLGVSYAGGCCGTGPDYIRELRSRLP